MNRLLLDTQALLWFLLDDPRLSSAALANISDANNQILVSPATLWEIGIKISIGKYVLPEPFEPFMDRELADNNFVLLPILTRHVSALTSMAFHHRDPFDRLIIAQAMVEDIPLVSADAAFASYPVTVIW